MRRWSRSSGEYVSEGLEDDDNVGSSESGSSNDEDDDEPGMRSSKRQKMGDYKYKEVVRGKAREALPGHDCPQCQAFWEAVGEDAKILADAGIKMGDLCKEHSRHRARFKAPETPENYWNLSMQSVREGSPGMNINESIVRY